MLSTFATLLAVLGTVTAGVLDLPDHRRLAYYEPPQATRLYAADGRLVREYYRENRAYVPIESMPPYLVQAFISAEDQRFREHFGIDFGGLARAALVNVRNAMTDRRLHGGSTITQQLAKNLLLTNEVSLLRKAREIVLAILIERTFDKDTILELYLNQIYLGRGAYGVGTASMRYFGVPPAELTLAQAAFLAALPKAPNNYHPIFRYDAAVARRNYVLDRMVEDGAITAEEAEAARAEPLEVRERAAPDTVSAPYFAEEVRRFLRQTYGSDLLYEGGLAVRTTLDPHLQELARNALREGLMAYDRRHGWRGPISNMSRIVSQQAALDEAAAAAPEPEADTPAPVNEAANEEADGGGGGLLGAVAGLRDRLAGRDAPEDPAEDEAAEDEAAAEPVPLWQTVLAEIDPPPGAEAWRLAVVLETGTPSARIGLDDGEIGSVPLEEVRWARRQHPGGWLGPAIHRVSDVLAMGDVVLVEPVSAISADTAAAAGQTRDFALRQIPEVQGAIVVMDPETGRVVAMSGGFSYAMSEFNRATQAFRQPGSAFKPFVYLAALENGYSPTSVLLDVPVSVSQGPRQRAWVPENYGRDFHGALPLRYGVERSRNVMTVRLVLEMGIEPVAEVANAFGIYDDMPLLPSMTLGAGETTLLRLTNAYAMLANGGERVEPYLVERVQDGSGRTIYRADAGACFDCERGDWTGGPAPTIHAEREQVTDPVSAYQMVSILRGVVQRGTAARLAGLNLPLAGKTGTTNDAHDAWFVGFAPELAVGVYVGFDEPRSLGAESGSTAAVPIFGAFMEAALRGRRDRDFAVPEGVTTVWVNRWTGSPASAGSSGAILEVMRDGWEPSDRPQPAVFNETAERAFQGTGGLY
jgi:penicillin-binding protein 1A